MHSSAPSTCPADQIVTPDLAAQSSLRKSLAIGILLATVAGAAVPLGQTAYLKAGNADPRDRFGAAVAASGDLLAVGAPGEGSGTTGVNGDPADDSLFAAGAVYVFALSGDSWTQVAYLKASDTHQQDEFGAAVAMDGDTLVVGAPGWSTNGNGVASGPGAAYVFVRQDGMWIQQAMLQAANAGQSDEFGAAVAVDGDTVVIGARSEDGGAVDINGDGSDNSIPQAGAAYVFVREEGQWTQQAYLKASNNRRGPFGAGGEFGYSVSVSGNTLVVGARVENSSATGVNGSQNGLNAPSSGAAYVFLRTGSTWTHQAYLKASNTEAADRFGSAVAISGDRVVVGAPGESGGGSGTDGDPADNSTPSAGAVYEFVRTDASWRPEAYLKASKAGAADRFGGALAMAGDVLVVGALGESAQVSGVNGRDDNEGAPRSGAAYRFLLRDGAWSAPDYLKAGNSSAGDEFGVAVAVTDRWLIAGALREDGGAPGDGSDDSASDAGAAYVFSGAPLPGVPTVREVAFTGNVIRFSLAVPPGQPVGIEYSESGPGGPWLDLGLLPTSEGVGTFEDTDPVRSGRALGYYRAVLH